MQISSHPPEMHMCNTWCVVFPTGWCLSPYICVVDKHFSEWEANTNLCVGAQQATSVTDRLTSLHMQLYIILLYAGHYVPLYPSPCRRLRDFTPSDLLAVWGLYPSHLFISLLRLVFGPLHLCREMNKLQLFISPHLCGKRTTFCVEDEHVRHRHTDKSFVTLLIPSFIYVDIS